MSEPILLVQPPCPDAPPMYFGPPYGLAVIAACLEAGGRRVACRDFERASERTMIDACLDLVAEQRFGAVGIGGTTSSRPGMFALARALHTDHPEITLVAGGPFATSLPELVLEAAPFDAVVLGDGERSVVELVEQLDRSGPLEEVAGLALRRNGQVLRTARRPRLVDVDALPYPAFHLFDVAGSLAHHRDFLATELGRRQLASLQGRRCASIPAGLMLLSSYGCHYGCAFCRMSQEPAPRYRAHSPEYFVDMLAHFAERYALRHFIFGDNLFSAEPARARAICDRIMARGLEIEWMCMTRTDRVDGALLERMAAAGCIEIVFGVESMSLAVHQAIGKGLDLDSVAPAIDGCRRAGIRSVMSLMVGNPGESRQTVQQTLRAVRELEPDEAQVKITKIYPGTDLFDRSVTAGAISTAYYLGKVLQPPAYTLEYEPVELETLAALIAPRTVALQLCAPCRPGCAHCTTRAAPTQRPAEDIEDDLWRLGRRCQAVRLVGEPAWHPALPTLLSAARTARIRTIEMETSAMPFASPSAELESSLRLVDRMLVRVPSRDAGRFDAVCCQAGRLPEVLTGVERLRALGCIELVLLIDLWASVLHDLAATVAAFADEGISRVRLRYAPRSAGRWPDIERAGTAAAAALAVAQARGGQVSISGLPYCAAPELVEHIDDLHHPFDEVIDLQGALYNTGKRRRRGRHYPERCHDCVWRADCEGMWLSPGAAAPCAEAAS